MEYFLMLYSPLFSVIIPVYNKEDYVARAIKSVLDQGYNNFEVIIVNDSSQDRSLEEIQKFSDPRIKVFHRDTPGPGGYAARNLGIGEALGKWIAFLDADDIWEPSHLQTVYENIGKDIDVICCGFRFDTGRTIKPAETQIYKGYAALTMLENKNTICTNSIAARKTSLTDAGLFPSGRCRRGGDSDLWLRLLFKARNTVAVAKVTSVYFTAASGVISNKRNIGTRHPVIQTVQCLLKTPSLTKKVQNTLKRIANRKSFSWALEAKVAGSLLPIHLASFYFSAFSVRDFQKFSALLLPRPIFLHLAQSLGY